MSARTRSARGFTLIELLVVITIIGLLAAIVIPALAKALSGAKKARAMREVTELEGAIKRFYSEYGKMPMPKGVKVGDADQEFTAAAQAEVLQVLLNLDDNWGLEERNTKQIVFLDLDPGSFKGADGKPLKTVAEMQVALMANGFRDPWDQPYGIIMDLNMDDLITGLPYGAGTVRAKVGVYSLGEGGADNQENPPYKTW